MDTSIQRDLMGYGFMALAGYFIYKKLFGPGEERIPKDSPIAVDGLTGGLLQTSYNLGEEVGEAAGDLINAARGISLPEISLPEISLPEISLPEISLPEISLPEISPLPSIPEAIQDSPLADFISEGFFARRGTPQILPIGPIKTVPIEEPTASISLPVYGAVSGVPTRTAPVIPDPVAIPVGGGYTAARAEEATGQRESVWVSGVGWARPGSTYYPGG